MLFALLLAVNAAGWVPARWPASDPKSLELVSGTPVNCLLVEQRHWSAPFNARARELKITTLAVVRTAADAGKAQPLGFDGIVLEGEFDRETVERLKPVAVLSMRRTMRWDLPVAATTQGLWPGIHVQDDGATKAAPTGAPWIDTNTGFLRFARSMAAGPVWIANVPPAKNIYPAARYLQAIGDAAVAGARWVIALDDDFSARLLAREVTALRDWDRMMKMLGHYESHSAWASLAPAGRFAVVQDASGGALLSGGILDMVATRHTPVRAVPVVKLSDERMNGATMAVNVDASAVDAERMQVLKRFTSNGGTLLSGPPGWRFDSAAGDAITLSDADVKKLDAIWREVNSMAGRRNLGARLFNVAGMLSNLLAAPGGGAVLHLVNYTSYPVEDITVHFLGKFRKATLYTPDAAPVKLSPYDVEEGTGVEIGRIVVTGTIVIEP